MLYLFTVIDIYRSEADAGKTTSFALLHVSLNNTAS